MYIYSGKSEAAVGKRLRNLNMKLAKLELAADRELGPKTGAGPGTGAGESNPRAEVKALPVAVKRSGSAGVLLWLWQAVVGRRPERLR